MKRILALSIAVILLFCSCSKGKDILDPRNSVTITLWHYYHGVQQTALDNMIKEFNSTEGLKRGIVVEAFSYGGVNELSDSVFASARGEAGSLSMPNIFSSYSDTVYELKKLDKLADLEDYFSEEKILEYVDSFTQEGRFSDGVLNVLPVAKCTEIFMLNKTDWDKFEQEVNADPNYENVYIEQLGTWEGILAAADVYYNWTDAKTLKEHDGGALFGLDSSANYFYIGARQLGLEIVDAKEEKFVFNEEVLRKLWDTFYVPMVKGEFAALGRFRSDDVKTGDLLCFVGASTSAAYFPLQVTKETGESYEIDAYVSCYPIFEDGEATVIQQGAGMCISKSDEKHEYASAEFLKWFTDPERNLDFAFDSSGYFPVTVKALSNVSESTVYQNLQSSDQKSDNNLAMVLEECFEQLNTYNLYSSPVFAGTAELRIVFEQVKTDAAKARYELLERVNAGAGYDAELELLINNAAFDQWITSLDTRNK